MHELECWHKCGALPLPGMLLYFKGPSKVWPAVVTLFITGRLFYSVTSLVFLLKKTILKSFICYSSCFSVMICGMIPCAVPGAERPKGGAQDYWLRQIKSTENLNSFSNGLSVINLKERSNILGNRHIWSRAESCNCWEDWYQSHLFRKQSSI